MQATRQNRNIRRPGNRNDLIQLLHRVVVWDHRERHHFALGGSRRDDDVDVRHRSEIHRIGLATPVDRQRDRDRVGEGMTQSHDKGNGPCAAILTEVSLASDEYDFSIAFRAVENCLHRNTTGIPSAYHRHARVGCSRDRDSLVLLVHIVVLRDEIESPRLRIRSVDRHREGLHRSQVHRVRVLAPRYVDLHWRPGGDAGAPVPKRRHRHAYLPAVLVDHLPIRLQPDLGHRRRDDSEAEKDKCARPRQTTERSDPVVKESMVRVPRGREAAARTVGPDAGQPAPMNAPTT